MINIRFDKSMAGFNSESCFPLRPNVCVMKNRQSLIERIDSPWPRCEIESFVSILVRLREIRLFRSNRISPLKRDEEFLLFGADWCDPWSDSSSPIRSLLLPVLLESLFFNPEFFTAPGASVD